MMNCCWLFWPRTGWTSVETLSRISAADAMLERVGLDHVERTIHRLPAWSRSEGGLLFDCMCFQVRELACLRAIRLLAGGFLPILPSLSLSGQFSRGIRSRKQTLMLPVNSLRERALY